MTSPDDHSSSKLARGTRLALFNSKAFDRGRPASVEALWILAQALFVSSFLPGSKHRVALLRLFGAQIGRGVVIKPRVRVKFPWRLTVGDDSWIGEGVWIDNLAEVAVGSNCCISQEAYLCTGSHNWSSERFDLIVRPIAIERGSWVAARAVVGPGVTIHEGAVLGLGSTATGDLEEFSVFTGNPAASTRRRTIKTAVSERSP